MHELGLERYAGIQDERAAIAGRLGYANAADAIAAHQASGANTAGSRDELLALAREQVERSWDASPRVLRAHAPRQLRRPAGRGVPGAGHAARLLQPADRGRIAPRRLLHQHVRPARPPAPSHREPHVPRGEPRPSLPALDRAGDPRPAGAAAVRRHPREQRVRGRVGPVQRAPGRRDGPVPGRLGAARHARGAGHARRPPGHRHGHPRARMVARAGDRLDGGDRHAARRRGDRDRPLHRDPGAGALVHDRDDRGRARATRRPASARVPRSRSPTSTTGCSRSVSSRCRRSVASSAEPTAPSRRRPEAYTRRITRPPTRGGAACSTSTSGSVRRSPWRT